MNSSQRLKTLSVFLAAEGTFMCCQSAYIFANPNATYKTTSKLELTLLASGSAKRLTVNHSRPGPPMDLLANSVLILKNHIQRCRIESWFYS
jgi:hypothetical protein